MVDDLYQELIIDHSKRPRNFHILDQSNREAEGYNPLCGDRLTLYLKMDGEIVKDASFVGCGCAISTASASLMTESLKGKTRGASAQTARPISRTRSPPIRQATKDLGKLVVFCGVRDYPARVKCATLAWHTLKNALEQDNKEVDRRPVASTE